jgi:hypothetical protein
MNAACARTEAACKTIAEAAKGLEQPAGQCKKQSKAYVATVIEGANVVMRTRGDCKTRRDRIAAGGAAISACGGVGRVRTADEIAMEEETMRYAMALVGEDVSSGITSADLARRPGADLGSQLADIKEPSGNVALGGGRGLRGSGDDVRVGDGRGPRSGLGSVAGDAPVDAVPSGRISVASKEALSESSLAVDRVLAKIQSAYMAGVKRCYRDDLEKDPTMRGNVILQLTVNETGRATEVSASGPSAALDACVTGLMASWRFPIPKDANGEATTATFKIQLGIVPD